MDLTSLSNSFKQIINIFGNGQSADIADSALKNSQTEQPKKELVEEFEKYMQEPDTAYTTIQKPQNKQMLQTEFSVSNNTIEQIDNTPVTSEHTSTSNQIPSEQTIFETQETIPVQDAATQNIQTDYIQAEPQEYSQEIQKIIQQIQNNSLEPTSLFRLQYLTTMLSVHVSFNSSTSQSITQQFETILRQQG